MKLHSHVVRLFVLTCLALKAIVSQCYELNA